MANPRTAIPEITEWVRRMMSDITEDGRVTRIQCWHQVEGEAAEFLDHCQIKTDSDPDDVTTTLWDAAFRDAKTRMIGRMQRYVLVAYRDGDEEEQPAGRMPFLLNGQASSDIIGSDSEPATPTGLQGQLMRHNEKKDAMIVQMSEMLSGRLLRDLEWERKRRIEAEEKIDKNREVFEDLQDRKHERDLEMQRELRKNERHEQMMGMMMTMMPLIMSKFLGAGAASLMMPNLPQAGARDEAIHQFLKGLSEEEAIKVLSVLPPAKQLELMEIYKAHKEEEEQRETKALTGRSEEAASEQRH